MTARPSWTTLLDDGADHPPRWWRWRISLIHAPSHSRFFSHPLYVLRYIFKTALRELKAPAQGSNGADGPLFTFHRLGAPFGSRLEKGAVYELEVILPAAVGAEAIGVIARILRKGLQRSGVDDANAPSLRAHCGSATDWYPQP